MKPDVFWYTSGATVELPFDITGLVAFELFVMHVSCLLLPAAACCCLLQLLLQLLLPGSGVVRWGCRWAVRLGCKSHTHLPSWCKFVCVHSSAAADGCSVMPLSGSLPGTAASHRADANVWYASAPRVCACTQWVESRRGYDIKKPGSMDQDPIFRCASCGVLVDGWLVRPAAMGGRLSGSMGQDPSRRCAGAHSCPQRWDMADQLSAAARLPPPGDYMRIAPERLLPSRAAHQPRVVTCAPARIMCNCWQQLQAARPRAWLPRRHLCALCARQPRGAEGQGDQER